MTTTPKNGTPEEELPDDLAPMSKAERKQLRKEVAAADRTFAQSRMALRRKLRGLYAIQALRMASAGRTQKYTPEIQLHENDIAFFEAKKKELMVAERQALQDVEDHLKTIPFYRDVLSDKTRYRGLGPTMAAVIISEFDIEKADTVSKMWSFAGLVPIPCRRCKVCHSVMQEVADSGTDAASLYELETELLHNGEASKGGTQKLYKHKAVVRMFDDEGQQKKCPWHNDHIAHDETYASGHSMRPVKGQKLPYNAFLRSKLVEVLAGCMLKVGSPWRKFYDEYKQRKESQKWGISDGHRHRASMRYMIKMLLIDIHRRWREFEGLSVRPPYAEEKLGHTYSGSTP